MGFLVVICYDVINNFFQTFRTFHQFLNIDIFNLNIDFSGTVPIVYLPTYSTENFSTFSSLMASVITYLCKQSLNSSLVVRLPYYIFNGIFSKDGCTGETEHLDVPEEVRDAMMGFPEL